MQTGFPSKGKLSSFPLARLLHLLSQEKVTGGLYIKRGKLKKALFFREGELVFIRSNLVGETLGRLLVSRGRISQQQCEDVVSRMKVAGMPQGAVLREMGILSGEELEEALSDQLRHKLLNLFTWKNGSFLFNREADLPEMTSSLGEGLSATLFKGVSGMSRSVLEAIVQPYLNLTPALRPDAPHDLGSFSHSEELAAMATEWLDGTPLQQILDRHVGAERGDFLALLATLIMTDMVSFSRDGGKKKKTAERNREAKEAAAPKPASESGEDEPAPEDDTVGIIRKASGLLAEGRNSEAVEMLEQAISEEDGRAELFAEYGWAVYLAGEQTIEATKRALDILKKALAMRGNLGRAYLHLARIFEARGQLEKAQTFLRKAGQEDPSLKPSGDGSSLTHDGSSVPGQPQTESRDI